MNTDNNRNIQNRKCSYENAEQEIEARHQVGAEVIKVYRKILPDLLKDLSKIEDPRNPQKIKHTHVMLMLYGILLYVFHMESRRAANRKVSRILMDNMQVYFPELATLPHADTLARLLEKIEADKIEDVIVKLIKRLMAGKQLDQFKYNGKYIIAFDGTGKFTREWEWSESCLKKQVKGMPEGVYKYYTYVLEASIVLPNGVTIPFMSEFLDREEFSIMCDNEDKLKQDCEARAFKRLAGRVKKLFPKLGIAVTLDGLYANGPIMEILNKYKWDFMITLKNESLKSVWEEYEGLEKIDGLEKNEGKLTNHVQQSFHWVNDIEYRYGINSRKKMFLNLVVCEETVYVKNKDTGKLEISEKKRYAWLSSKRLTQRNVSGRCNSIGRSRWNIETQNLVEKHHGYAYQHCFSYDWNAMRCFHYIMHIGHIVNVFTMHFKKLRRIVKEKGVRGTVEFILLIFSGCPLDAGRIKEKVNKRYQYRFEI